VLCQVKLGKHQEKLYEFRNFWIFGTDEPKIFLTSTVYLIIVNKGIGRRMNKI